MTIKPIFAVAALAGAVTLAGCATVEETAVDAVTPSYHTVLTGANEIGGGDPDGYGKAEVTKGTASAPNMTLSMSAQDYVDMIMGKLNGQMAFMSGKLKISGDMGLAMKMQSLFKRPGA